MADNYTVKINRRDGTLEITGDKEWVDAKLTELADVLTVSGEPVDGGGGGADDSVPRRTTRKREASTTQASPSAAKPARRKGGSPSRVKGLDLAPFEAFVSEKQPKTQHDRTPCVCTTWWRRLRSPRRRSTTSIAATGTWIGLSPRICEIASRSRLAARGTSTRATPRTSRSSRRA